MGSLVSPCLSGGNPMLIFSGFPSGNLSVDGLYTLQQPRALRSDSSVYADMLRSSVVFFCSCRSMLGCVKGLSSLLLAGPLPLA